MKIADIEVGAEVQVLRGYSLRPAVVTGIRTNGKIGVRFLDTAGYEKIPPLMRGHLFGAEVRPNAIQPKAP